MNDSSARRLPASPIAAARGRSEASATIASASSSASPGGTTSPVSPSATISGRPPTALAMTGRARSMASSATIPNPSPSEGTTTIVACSIAGLHRRDEAEEPNRVAEPELARVAPKRRLERTRAGDVEDEPGHACSRLGERPQEDEVALDRDQPADAEQARLRARERRDAVSRSNSVVDDLEAVARRIPPSRRGSARGLARWRCGRERATRPSGLRARRSAPRGTS